MNQDDRDTFTVLVHRVTKVVHSQQEFDLVQAGLLDLVLFLREHGDEVISDLEGLADMRELLAFPCSRRPK